MVDSFFGTELCTAAIFDELETLIHFFFEAHIKHAICFINDHILQVVQFDTLRVFQMVEETTWGGHQDSDAFAQA